MAKPPNDSHSGAPRGKSGDKPGGAKATGAAPDNKRSAGTPRDARKAREELDKSQEAAARSSHPAPQQPKGRKPPPGEVRSRKPDRHPGKGAPARGGDEAKDTASDKPAQTAADKRGGAPSRKFSDIGAKPRRNSEKPARPAPGTPPRPRSEQSVREAPAPAAAEPAGEGLPEHLGLDHMAVGPEDDDAPVASAPLRPFRCGHVTLTGQPNVGKSTLLNQLVGEKLAIVSPKPQTTRDQIRGIWTSPDTQVVFLDTPGIHRARSPLNRAMVGTAIEALEAVDVVVLVIDAVQAARFAEKKLRRQARSGVALTPVTDAEDDDDFGLLDGDAAEGDQPEQEQAVAAAADADEAEWAGAADAETDDGGAADREVANEDDADEEAAGDGDADDDEDDDEDAGADQADLDAAILRRAGSHPGAKIRAALDPLLVPGDRRVIHNILRYNQNWMVAINKTDAIRPRLMLPIMQALASCPGVGPVVPISARTGDGMHQLVEAIRSYLPEQEAEYGADELTDRSLRFLCAELVREQVFLQTRDEVPYGVACEIEKFEELADLTHIQAVVHVEKPAQRGILIGKGGARMKELATEARLQMQQLLDRKVFLEVHVRVEPEWSERTQMLKQFGYIL